MLSRPLASLSHLPLLESHPIKLKQQLNDDNAEGKTQLLTGLLLNGYSHPPKIKPPPTRSPWLELSRLLSYKPRAAFLAKLLLPSRAYLLKQAEAGSCLPCRHRLSAIGFEQLLPSRLHFAGHFFAAVPRQERSSPAPNFVEAAPSDSGSHLSSF